MVLGSNSGHWLGMQAAFTCWANSKLTNNVKLLIQTILDMPNDCCITKYCLEVRTLWPIFTFAFTRRWCQALLLHYINNAFLPRGGQMSISSSLCRGYASFLFVFLLCLMIPLWTGEGIFNTKEHSLIICFLPPGLLPTTDSCSADDVRWHCSVCLEGHVLPETAEFYKSGRKGKVRQSPA